MSKYKYRYDIMRLSDKLNDEKLNPLKDMDLIVLRFESYNYTNDTIICPLYSKNYDSYFKWLFDKCSKYDVCVSENFEDFKKEYFEFSDELSPSIADVIDVFDQVRVYGESDMSIHKKEYDKYLENNNLFK